MQIRSPQRTSTKAGKRLLAVVAGLAAVAATACGARASSPAAPGVINAVGAENEYADVISQIGGSFVHATSILNNPNTDPHTFESSPSVAEEISGAKLIVQNGVGYDDFMSKIESASSNASRKVIVVQHVLGLPDSTPNPHLWYAPTTMPAVAAAIGNDLAALEPDHSAYFQQRVQTFDSSLTLWMTAIASFRARFGGTAVATTEPVADYLLTAMGIDNLTPFGFQAAIMNGTDPTPQDISLEKGFFTKHQVKVFCYNGQVVDDLTASIRSIAKDHNVPVVGVYETMPTPGYDYQSWMLAEVNAITNAVANGASSPRL